MKRCYLCAMVMLLCLLALPGFTRAQSGSINGVFYIDINGDRSYNGESGTQKGDSLLTNATVELYRKNGQDYNRVASTATDINGRYSFLNLENANDYYVRFVIPADEQNIYEYIIFSGDDPEIGYSDIVSDQGYTGAIQIHSKNNQNDNKYNIDGGLKIKEPTYGSITGTVWEGSNSNGSKEHGEGKGVKDVVVKAYDCGNNGKYAGEGITKENGTYTIDNLITGLSYRVTFEPAAGYSLVDKGTDSDPDSSSKTTECSANALTTSGLVFNSGVFKPSAGGNPNGQINGRLWLDANHDGAQGGIETEPGIGNWRLRLLNSSKVVVDSTITDTSNAGGQKGRYTFTKLDLGIYYIQFVKNGDYSFTDKNSANNDESDSDVNPETGITDSVVIDHADASEEHIDAGVYLNEPPAVKGRISGILWQDTDKNGAQALNNSEPGIGNWKVRLLNSDKTVVVDSAETDNTGGPGTKGTYEFSGLIPGTYYVKFVKHTGYTFTSQNAVGNDDIDSDVDTSGITDAIVINNNNTIFQHVDAGVYEEEQQTAKGKINGILWLDANKNGAQGGNNSEPGIGDWTVKLLNSSKVVVDSIKTKNSGGLGTLGTFEFSGITPGDYYVKFVKHSGYVFTAKNAANNDEIDSDVDTSGITDLITIDKNSNIQHMDAGIYEAELPVVKGRISGLLWQDADKNGAQSLDNSEPGIGNWKVRLLNSDKTIVVDSAETRNNGGLGTKGAYEFTNITPGTYYIKFVKHSGFTFTSKDAAGNDDIDSDVDTSGLTGMITVENNSNIQHVDAGVYEREIPEKGSIGDFVWNDENKNGIQDYDEPGVPNVTVLLYSSNNTNLSIAQRTTDYHGKYLFTNLNPGTYRLRFILPYNFKSFTGMGAGSNDALDSDVNPMDGLTGTVTLTAASNRLDIDAGLIKKTTEKAGIGDLVWKDLDQDGLQDKGEPGIPNVMVELYKWGSNIPAMTAISDSKGYYLFDNLVPDDYYVKFILPEGFTFTRKDQGSDDAFDSDADRQTGKSDQITLSGEDNLTIDAGLYGNECMPVSLGDFVWNDLNKNGIQNSGEPGLSQITVNLFKAGKTAVHKTTLTDKNGFYHFAGLLPGTYYVQFILPKGFSFTLMNQGANDALDSDADMTSGITASYNLASGEANNTIDAGLFEGQCLLANLGDYVWNDCNRNGIQDVGESGIGGIELKLHICTGSHTNPADPCSFGNVVASAKTDKNGKYMFANIMPGYYFLEIVVPCNFTITKPDQAEDFKDSDIIPSLKHTACIKVNPGETNLTVDAGLYPTPPATIGDLVWIDANKNGIQDNGEKGLCNVTVELYMCGVSAPVAAAKTDSDGKYLFKNVIPNTSYSVKFCLPKGYTFTSLDQGGNDNFDSDVCPKNNGMTKFYDILPDEVNLSIDCGMYLSTTSACNFVWKDNNNNGLKDDGEAGIQGVTVELYQCSNNSLVQSVKTDAAGLFTFKDILLDSYYLKILVPDGYKIGKASPEGGAKGVTSDFGTNGQSSCFDVADGTTSIGKPVALVLSTTGIKRGAEIPTEFTLQQNYPNPFNPSTTIEFAVPAAGQYTLRVFNMLGQEVATLLDRELPVGYHMVVFDASGLTSGMYIYRLSGNNVVMIKKMMLSK
ncbi:MAG: SdrD B-like domain-containing protein [Bacteroidota bacterium]